MSVRKGNKVVAGGNSTRIDSALSLLSANPVQNKVITEAIQGIDVVLGTKQDIVSAGSGITIESNEIAVGNLDCGTMS